MVRWIGEKTMESSDVVRQRRLTVWKGKPVIEEARVPRSPETSTIETEQALSYRCSSCHKAAEEVRRLISMNDGNFYLCDDCIGLAVEILVEEDHDVAIEVSEGYEARVRPVWTRTPGKNAYIINRHRQGVAPHHG